MLEQWYSHHQCRTKSYYMYLHQSSTFLNVRAGVRIQLYARTNFNVAQTHECLCIIYSKLSLTELNRKTGAVLVVTLWSLVQYDISDILAKKFRLNVCTFPPNHSQPHARRRPSAHSQPHARRLPCAHSQPKVWSATVFLNYTEFVLDGEYLLRRTELLCAV